MEFRLPEIGEGVYEAELTRWLVKPGDAVKSGQDLAEVVTDKATMNVPAPFAGTITELRAEVGQKVKVGEVILAYNGTEIPAGRGTTVGAGPVASLVQKGPTGNGLAAPAPGHPLKAAPSVRLLARKMGIDLDTVAGSGPDGRILVDDLTEVLRGRAAAPSTPALPSSERAASWRGAESKPDLGRAGTRLKLVGLRRTIAERMTQSKRTIPDYSYVDECDVTDLVKLRDSLRDAYVKAGIKLTYLSFFVKAVVAALKEVPLANATLDETAGEIVLHDRYHIGIATSTGSGLVVPVVRDADRKDLGTIAREIDRLSTAARTGHARPDELRGSTFTITSVGNIGGLFSTPVINPPEVGILGIGKIVRRPVFDANGQVRPADLVYLSLTFDHRVVDGAVCAHFSNAVIQQLQNPALMLLPPSI
jgi:pyruvate dehydrogenase E2 component (dihydrolipoamide acetyltransferase)/2-oxoisovalerate dehydrogenase E2 component (dihydrolipoyl transacylase)